MMSRSFYGIVCIVAACCLPMDPLRSATCETVPSDAVSWWPGESNARDSIGENHGTLGNGATFAPGRVGRAFSFDGVDDVVSIPAPSGMPVGNAARTVELWFRTPRNLTSFTESALFLYGTQSANNAFGLITSVNAPGKLYFYGNANDLAGVTTIQPDTWHHAAVTYDGATVNLYLNGELEASKDTATLNTMLDENGFLLGERPGSGRWEGLIDEPAVYSRALSAAEITAIFNAGSLGKCPPSAPVPDGLVSSWKAEGTANDTLGANHGSLENGPLFVPGLVGQAFALDGVDDHIEIEVTAEKQAIENVRFWG